MQENRLHQLFLEEFSHDFPDWRNSFEYVENQKLIIPAKSPATGDLFIRFDADEITVLIGESFHTHFDIYSNLPTIEERIADAAKRANLFIRELMSDKLVIFMAPRSSGCYEVGTDLGGLVPPDARRFLWSGEIKSGATT